MSFSKENTQRLTELFELIKEKGGCNVPIFTYRSVPYLKEIDEIVKSQLSSEEQLDKETLREIREIPIY